MSEDPLKKTTTPPGTKSSVPPVKKTLGTLSLDGGVGLTHSQRLQSIRSPNKTLGGAPKRTFIPNVAGSKTTSSGGDGTGMLESKPEVNLSSLLKSSTETHEQAQKQIEQRLAFQQKKAEAQARRKAQTTPTATLSKSDTPFAIGPPPQDKRKKGQSGVHLATDIEDEKLQDTEMKLEISDPYHPTSLPFPDKQSLNKAEMPFSIKNELSFIQLPSSLPITATKQAEDQAKVPYDAKRSGLMPLEEEFTSTITEVPEGHLGKLRIYKSGKMKLQIGEFLYDVTPTTDSPFLQQIMVIDKSSKKCFQLGDVAKRYISVPDFNTLLPPE